MKYTKPEIEVVEFEVTDVITASEPGAGSGVLEPGLEVESTVANDGGPMFK